MTGTVKQDGEMMASVITKIAMNMTGGLDFFNEVDEKLVVDGWRVNIPYSTYTVKEK